MSHSVSRPIQLGLCCMNVTLKEQKVPVYAARRIIIKTIEKLGIEELKKRTLQNLDDLLKMLQWNEANGIRVFRLSSEMFQHKTNPKVPDYTYDFAIEHLKRIGDYAKEKGHRLTFHPGQFNNLGSPRQKVVEQTFKDLEYHADVLDLLGFQYNTPHGRNSVMVIHGGGVYGDKKGAMKRWVENYHKLPDKIKNRLVLENCEKCYSIMDCLELSAKTGVPVVLDTHHFECYKQLHPDEKFRHPSEYIPMILESWTDKKMKPKFHVSEQGSGKIGHHSDYIEILPQYLLDIPEKYGIDIDIMIEAKMKELSIQKLYEKYPQCNCLKDNPYYVCKEIMEEIINSIEENVNPIVNTFENIKKCIINKINHLDVISLKTTDGNTQNTERKSISLIRDCLSELSYSFEEAGSQQSKDFRNINNIGLDIEIKKTDGYTVYFNDTLPNKNIYYIIFFTGKKYKNKNTEDIPPQIIFINGLDLIDEDMELALEYQKDIEQMRDKWSRKKKGGNALLFKYMSVCPRATYKTSIKHLLNSQQSFVLMGEEQHSLSV